MFQNTAQVDTLITFVNAFLAGELTTLPEIHRAECEALASVVGTSSEQRAGILQNIRHVPKYKAFDELLKRWLDPQPDTLPQERPYQLYPLSHYKNRPLKEWAVDGIVFDRGSSLFAGPGGSGKSAFVLDMCLSRVCGLPFLGRKVKPAFLIWVAAESLDELFPRAQAWLHCHNRSAEEPLDMLVLEERMPLNDPGETEKFILSTNAQLAEANVTPATHSLLVVFDTYSKCTPGSDENNTKDVKGVVEQIDRVCVEMNAHVLIICHTNSDGVVKGNKALRDGVDTVWMVDKNNENIRLTNDKMRGAPEPEPFYACMRSIILDKNNLDRTAPVIFDKDGKDGSIQFMPDTHVKMLSVLQEHGKMSTNNWQKQCETVHRIKRTSFFLHLKKLRADKLVSEPPEGITKGTKFDYSITEKGIELLERSSE